MADNGNMSLWQAVRTIDPKYTKPITGKSFGGTSPSPMKMIEMATEQWGPIGEKWGIRVVKQEYVNGSPLIASDKVTVIGHEIHHIVQAEIFHPGGSFHCFGQTVFSGQRKARDGVAGAYFTDEDASKKSLTDALTKGLSWLGFAADIHMGRYDDVKYVEHVREEFAEKEQRQQTEEKWKVWREATVKDFTKKSKSMAEMGKAWEALTKEGREACAAEKDRLKKEFAKKETADAAANS